MRNGTPESVRQSPPILGRSSAQLRDLIAVVQGNGIVGISGGGDKSVVDSARLALLTRFEKRSQLLDTDEAALVELLKPVRKMKYHLRAKKGTNG
jgi:hypothetical protein